MLPEGSLTAWGPGPPAAAGFSVFPAAGWVLATPFAAAAAKLARGGSASREKNIRRPSRTILRGILVTERPAEDTVVHAAPCFGTDALHDTSLRIGGVPCCAEGPPLTEVGVCLADTLHIPREGSGSHMVACNRAPPN